MNRDEIKKQIENNKFSKAIRCYNKDELCNLIEEIYYDGIWEGYSLAVHRLDSFCGLPFGMADEYLGKNMEKIRMQLELCRMLEKTTTVDREGIN